MQIKRQPLTQLMEVVIGLLQGLRCILSELLKQTVKFIVYIKKMVGK